MTIRKGKVLVDSLLTKIYNTSEEEVILHFTDVAAFQGAKKSVEIKSKGMITSQIASCLYRYLESYHIDTFFVESLKNSDLLVRRFGSIPIRVKMWNLASGILCKQFGFKNLEILNYPIMETYYQDEKQQYVPAIKDHLYALNILNPRDFISIDAMSRKINTLLKSFFERRHLIVADFCLFFGKINEKIVICGGMDFESLHIGSYDDEESKTNFRFIQFNATTESYQAVKDRIVG